MPNTQERLTLQNDSTLVKAALHCLVTLPLQASHIHLPLGFYLPCDNVALEGVGHSFRKLAQKKHQGAEHLQKMQSQYGGLMLFQETLEPVHGESGVMQATVETTMGMDKNLT